MGLKADITADLAAAFDTDLADAVATVTATTYADTQASFDPATGTAIRTPTSFSIRGVMMDIEKRDEDTMGGKPGTRQFLVLEEELAAAGTLLVNDTVLDGNNLYTVYQILKDPADATHTFLLKGTNP